jgi:hypothetical protein
LPSEVVCYNVGHTGLIQEHGVGDVQANQCADLFEWLSHVDPTKASSELKIFHYWQYITLDNYFGGGISIRSDLSDEGGNFLYEVKAG